MATARFGVNETECNGFPVGEYGSKTHAKPLCAVQGVAVLSSRLIQSNQPRTAHRERINRESSVDAPLCRSTPKRSWSSDAGTGMSPLLYWFLWLSSRLRVSPQTLAKRGVLLVFFNQFITGLGPVFTEEVGCFRLVVFDGPI